MRRVCLNSIHKLAGKDNRVIFIGSDLGPGTLEDMHREIPNRFFMEGISEQHIIGMSAGLAMEGFIPFVNTIAPFLTRRCYEQIAIDLCLHDLPVRLIGNGGGVVYAPLGPTHLATEDIAIMRALPNMTIVAPCDAEEMGRLMEQTLDWPHPMYIRLAKGGDKIVSKDECEFEIGKAILMREPGDGLFITTGVMTQLAIEATEKLETDYGIRCGVLHMHTVKPIDSSALAHWLPKTQAVLTVEEHTRIGGLGSAVLEYCSDELPEQVAKIARIGIPDRYADKYGSQNSLLDYWNITVETISEAMHKKLKKI